MEHFGRSMYELFQSNMTIQSTSPRLFHSVLASDDRPFAILVTVILYKVEIVKYTLFIKLFMASFPHAEMLTKCCWSSVVPETVSETSHLC